jgi:hypothetical protein
VFNLGAAPAQLDAPAALGPVTGHGFEAELQGAIITLPGYGAFFGAVPPQQGHEGGSDG